MTSVSGQSDQFSDARSIEWIARCKFTGRVVCQTTDWRGHAFAPMWRYFHAMIRWRPIVEEVVLCSSLFWGKLLVHCNANQRIKDTTAYDTVSDVVESGVHWGSNFQIGSRVLKICFKPILMHIYGMQYDFMHRSCWNHSNFENSWFYNVISTLDPQNHCLLGSRNRVAVAVE